MAFESPEQADRAFYEAFTACDIEAMREIWGEGDVICVHPGAVPLLTHEAILRSWAHIFTDSIGPSMRVQPLRRIETADMAVFLCEEQISTPDHPESYISVLATNIYRRYESGWRMAFHQGVLMSGGQSAERPTIQ